MNVVVCVYKRDRLRSGCWSYVHVVYTWGRLSALINNPEDPELDPKVSQKID